MSVDYVELIIRFGLLGNGLDREVRPFGRVGNLEVHCGSGTNGVELAWFHENLTEVLTFSHSRKKLNYSNCM